MFKALKISATALALALVAVAATSAIARGEPWLSERPEMTDEQLASVQAAIDVRMTLPDDGFGWPPKEVGWADDRGMRKPIPVSNISIADLTRLIQGRYRVQIQGSKVTIQFFGADGMGYSCSIDNNRVRARPVRYKVKETAFGLAGLAFTSDLRSEPEGGGWPTVGDRNTGLLYQYTYDRKGVYNIPGWIQNEIPAVAVEVCPDMPNNGNVNLDQVSADFQDLLANSKRVTNFNVAFPNNPQDPITAEMFYHFYGPGN